MKFRRRKWVAIDYDRREVRLVVYEHVHKMPTILSMHTAAVPGGLDIADAAAFGGFLKSVVDKLHLGGANAVMCVGRAQAVLKSLTLPGTASGDDLASMVQYQVGKELPFSAEEAVVDYTRGSHWDTDQQQEIQEGTTVLAAAVRIPVLEAAREICTAAGLKLQRLGLRPYANLRAVYRCSRDRAGQRLLLVNVTADEAEIDVMRDEMLEFSRAATVSPPDQPGPQPPTTQQPAEAVRRIVTEVTRSLHSFHAVQRGARLDGCLIAGNTGLEGKLADALADRLGGACELLDPARGFTVQGDRAVSAFAAALGLTTGALAEQLPFDFLNPNRPAPPTDRRRAASLAAVTAAVFVTALTILGMQLHVAGRERALGKLEEKNGNLRADNQGLKKLQKRVLDIRMWMGDEICWLDRLAHLSRTLPPAEKIYLDSLRCSPAIASKQARSESRQGKMAIAGRVKDSQVIPQFEQKLAGPETKVSHKGTGPITDRYGYGVKFNVDLLIPAGGATTRPARAGKAGKAGGRH